MPTATDDTDDFEFDDTPFEEPLTDYWSRNYTEKNLCSLCGNWGVIDTRGVRTASGVEVGRLNYCICPNGQKLREDNASLAGRQAQHHAQENPRMADQLLIKTETVFGSDVPASPAPTKITSPFKAIVVDAEHVITITVDAEFGKVLRAREDEVFAALANALAKFQA